MCYNYCHSSLQLYIYQHQNGYCWRMRASTISLNAGRLSGLLFQQSSVKLLRKGKHPSGRLGQFLWPILKMYSGLLSSLEETWSVTSSYKIIAWERHQTSEKNFTHDHFMRCTVRKIRRYCAYNNVFKTYIPWSWPSIPQKDILMVTMHNTMAM